jgi:transcriptional regulator with XRE-family HTH domain
MEQQRRRGRPPKPLDPDASQGARLGAEIRAWRQTRGLTQTGLGILIGYSPQHISQIELAQVPVSKPFVMACDRVLETGGTLLELFPAATYERAMQRHDRSVARHEGAGEMPADETQAPSCASDLTRYAGQPYPSDLEEDVDVNRRSVIGAGVGAVVGLNATTAPASARVIDPEFVDQWMELLNIVSRHGARRGPRDLLGLVRQQIGMIAECRQVAGGLLNNQLLRVESRWADFAASLSNQIGNRRHRDAWTDHALALAREAEYYDMVAYLLMRRSQWAAEELDARRTIDLAEAGLGVPGTRAHTRAFCAMKAALGYALAGDAASCERSLADTAHLLADMTKGEPATPWEDLSSFAVSAPYVRAGAARCWLSLRPQKAIAMFEDALPRWPSDHTCDRGLNQARLALACAAGNEPDRATVEGMKALGIARKTRSDLIARELKRLDQRLAGFDVAGVGEFREAFGPV